jgi:hypothetical protein
MTETNSQPEHGSSQHPHDGSYVRFFAMIATSMVVMHSYKLIEHAWFSETRLFMTLIMGGGMVFVMLAYMLGMYKSTPKNLATFGVGAVLIAAGIFLVRSQVTVSDTDYMEGMIPHHSIAILTSERAQIEDLRVRELADKIIEAQRREIAEMEWLISDIRENGVAQDQARADARPVPDFDASPR